MWSLPCLVSRRVSHLIHQGSIGPLRWRLSHPLHVSLQWWSCGGCFLFETWIPMASCFFVDGWDQGGGIRLVFSRLCINLPCLRHLKRLHIITLLPRIMEVENGCIWKVTTIIGGTQIFTEPWLMGGRVVRLCSTAIIGSLEFVWWKYQIRCPSCLGEGPLYTDLVLDNYSIQLVVGIQAHFIETNL